MNTPNRLKDNDVHTKKYAQFYLYMINQK